MHGVSTEVAGKAFSDLDRPRRVERLATWTASMERRRSGARKTRKYFELRVGLANWCSVSQ